MDDLIRGLVIGVALAAAVGPVGLICIRLALTQGQWPAVAAGLGAAAADAIFGAIGDLGLSLIQQLITSNQVVLGTIGGLHPHRVGSRNLASNCYF
jgi:threonine/homoserine/homoserine lactone efflux protein